MSSSNQVRLTFIEETVYGETPVAGNFKTARYTSDSLSGTPDTTESQQIRTDRYSSGQVVTGLTLSGDVNGELAKEDALDEMVESALYNTWATSIAVAEDMDIDATLFTITRGAGDFNSDVEVGDIITLSGFSNSVNNTQVMVASITSNTVITYIGPDTMVTESETGTSFIVSDKITIGTTKKSFSMEKAFLDLTEKAINYRGMIASSLSMQIAYGEIVNYTVGFSGNDYEPVEAGADFITDGRTLDAAATSGSMNGSIDMAFIGNSSTGTFAGTDFCIQSIDFNLNNNLTAQNCIGKVAPKDYSEGTASIEVSLSAYLSNESWSMLGKKLSQESFSIGFIIKNVDGYYGFFLPAVQVTGDDPASAGINQDVILSLTGTAKVGALGESPLTMFRG
jgi:hypothetical protein